MCWHRSKIYDVPSLEPIFRGLRDHLADLKYWQFAWIQLLDAYVFAVECVSLRILRKMGKADCSRYSGDLEIQIQGGPAIVVPNDVLVVPDLETDVSGATHRNDSLATLLINPLDSMQIEEGGTVLGMDFFANAYLIVNLDDSSWSLWPANRTTDARLVTIGNKQCDAANNESLPPNAVNSTKPASTASSTPLSSGAIAGIAVGSIAGLLLIVGLVVLAIRRRKSQGANHGEIGASETWQNHPQSGQKVASSDTSDADHRDLHPAEMTGNTVLPAELHVTQEPAELPRRYTYKGKPGYTLGDTAELPTTLTPRM